MTRKRFHTRFNQGVVVGTQNDGTITSGTAGEINTPMIGGIPWVQQVIGTQTTLTAANAAGGVDIKMTDTNGQGNIWVPYCNTLKNPLCYTIGTDPAFFMLCEVQVTDWSGCQFMVGFEGGTDGTPTLPALTATFADYTDKATIGNYAGGAVNCQIATAISDDADVVTDTTIDFTDGDVAEFGVYVSATGVVSYTLRLAASATPTTFVTKTLTNPASAFQFATGDAVVPFIFHINHTDTASAVVLRRLTIGPQ